MKLERANRAIESSGVMETAKATIKATPKIFNFFADQTYANKPRAICRELVANGIDSHTAAGCPDRPVEVTLPNDLDPVFKVRDFGVGMSHEFMMTRFMAYTDGSTKDQSNDQIGGFGIGSKSPFAYTDQYTLRVVHDGVLSVYTMFKDEEGLPSIGLMGQTTTDEPNGVEVSFPVENDDHSAFHEAAQEALQFFVPLPTVIGGEIDAPPYNYVGKGWMLRPTAGDLNVIMGGVRYPVATGSLEWDLRNDAKLSPLLSYGIDLILPIGACGIALSREALSYDGKTSANIETALKAVIDDVVSTFANMFDNCASMWDAIVSLHKETQGATASTGRAKLLAANAFWKGAKITNAIPTHGRTGIGSIWMIEPQTYRRKTIGSAKWEDLSQAYQLMPGNISTVIVDDLPISGKSKQIMKIKEYAETLDRSKQQILVLRANGDHTDRAVIAAALEKIGGPTDVVYTSTLPEPVSTSTGGGRAKSGTAYVRPHIRMFTFNGQSDNHGNTVTNLTPGWAKERCVDEIAYANQPTTGIMVGMNSFELPTGLRAMIATGLLRWDELRFVNQGDVNKIKAHFEDYKAVYETRKKAALAANPKLAARAAVALTDELDSLFGSIRDTIGAGKLTLTAAQRSRPFGRVVALWKEYVEPYDAEQHRLACLIKPVLPAKVKTAELRDLFASQQAEAKILFANLDLREQDHVDLIAKHL